MTRYDYFYKDSACLDSVRNESWTLFISGYNTSTRVTSVFGAVVCAKHWLIFSEYEFLDEEIPDSFVYRSSAEGEAEYVAGFFSYLRDLGIDVLNEKICIDITGFMRPHLIFMIAYLRHLGVTSFDVIYSEPDQYLRQEKTTFSSSPVVGVRPVQGYAGSHSSESAHDLLIVGVGYDHELTNQVMEYKDYAAKATIWGFPSLRADMYQENVLRAKKRAGEFLASEPDGQRNFSLANDPFDTAMRLAEIVKRHEAHVEQQAGRKVSWNLYLSPLSTKPQALGFAIYFLWECIDRNVSLIFPFCDRYSKETSAGIAKLWKYSVELPS